MKKKYSIGLDIGVASVGWACMTPDFRVLKFNGRYAMGVREFESAQTAEARRLQRGTRRRYNRRIRRIQLLQETLSSLFNDDPSFFIETDEKEKHFWRNSNQFENNSLSETLNYLGMNTRTYPTIYHLRYDLLTSDKKFHPRLIYLALHHLVKYRGHFLNENLSWTKNNKNESLNQLINQYIMEFENHDYIVKDLLPSEEEQISKILVAKDYTNSDKEKAIVKILGSDFRHPIKLLLGLKADVAKLFPTSPQIGFYKEEKLKISFADENIEEEYEKLTDEEKYVVDLANTIYQNVLLNDLLGDASCVAEAKVNAYEQFGMDLQWLKKIYNDHFGEKAYRDMFITTKKNKTKYLNTRKDNFLCEFDKFLKIHKYEDIFYKNIKKKLEILSKDDSLNEKDKVEMMRVIERLERNQFLRKQKGRDNAAIPHQNNVYEAEKILKNQQKFYPEITDSMITKVKQIISFRIPYYIGPLVKDNTNAEFGWADRKKSEHVLPWNIDEVIDRSKSAENFITRMTSQCSYLMNERVLPKHSLIYQKFELLNELNGIQIRASHELPHKDYRLGREEKQWLIENVFKKRKNITHRAIKESLQNSPFKHIILDGGTDSLKSIYGTQKEDRFSTNLSTYIDMENIFGDLSQIDINMLEEIIYWITVFEDKEIIAFKIREKYPQITEEQINRLVHLNYSGWGRLSHRLLNEMPVEKGDKQTILDVMKNESLVFMEVLSVPRFNFKERIAKINRMHNDEMTKIRYKDIKELQGSPAIKKGIWQAVLIVEELVEIFGEPEHIMIEFAREEDKKERTQNRKKQISDLQKAISRDEVELKKFLKEHSQYEEAKYRDNRLYLYITQEGKCLYSGESLNISRLQDYEVDHILPRSFVKDDSIDNLALVKKHMNQAKGSDKMPLEILSAKDQVKQKLFWKKLNENRLISNRKYSRLMKESFSAQDKESFFARQLVETRQITRHVRDLLAERFEHTEIHTVNANIVTGLRNHTNTIKIRGLNNKHHAVDAALSVIIVQFIIHKYGTNFLNFNFKYQEARKKWRQMLRIQGKNFFLFDDIDKYNKFPHYKTGELLSGREFLAMINDEMPWQTTKKIGSGEGAFYKETLFSPKVKQPKYKSNKSYKGVYDEMKTDSTYLISFIEKNKRGKKVAKSEFVDLYVIEKYQQKHSTEKELAIFLAKKATKNEVIDATIHTKILKYQAVTYRDYPFTIVSSKEKHNGKQLVLSPSLLQKLYKILIDIDEKIEVNLDLLRSTFSEIAEEVNKQYKEYLPEKSRNRIAEYSDAIIDNKSFQYGLDELFKTTSASAARSAIFGYRFTKKTPPTELKFIYQSITGLRHRKPKSYKKELWVK